MSVVPSPESVTADVEGTTPHDLFSLRLRVVWLENTLPRYRFRPPQAASLRRVGAPKPAQLQAPSTVSGLTALQKFALIRETGECCYWCTRGIGRQYEVRGEIVTLRLHWDHVIPDSAGGATDMTNIVPSCHLCNGWKSDRVFATEADVRTYLEERWTEAMIAPDVSGVEEPSAVATIEADEPSATAPVAVLALLGEAPNDAHTEGPEEAVPVLRASRARKPIRRQYQDARVVTCKCGTPFRPETRAAFQAGACCALGCSARHTKEAA